MFDFLKGLPPWLQLGLSFPLIFLNGWLLFILLNYFQPLSSIFVASVLLAFLLDLPVRSLQKSGLKKGWAISVVFSFALLVTAIALLILVPLIVGQLTELISNSPQWITSANEQLSRLQTWETAHNISVNLDLSQFINQAVEKLTSLLNSLGNQILNVVGVTITTLFNGLIIIVLTVFLVLTGEQVSEGIFSWLPAPWNQQLRETMRITFTRYFATQAMLAGILSLAQILVFAVLQVPYAVLFAITIGLTTLIPYASGISIVIISFLLMLQNFWLGVKVLIAAVIVGQINDNIVAPRLMGDMTGLNPVWIIVSLFVGGKLGGILGLLIAVPLASVIKSTVDHLRLRAAEKSNTVLMEGLQSESPQPLAIADQTRE
ncbi:MAG: AI-2E family transporter [Snowella sp.]|nr:AI-2E family transporter [Snowella sp.]